MIKLYGVAASRAARCLWMLEELQVEYEHVPINFSDECKTAEYLKLNPNGHIPTLVDGDTVLWESMAINLYLVQKFGGPLQPRTVEEYGHTVKWSFWGMTEVERPLLDLLFHRAIFPEGQRDRAVAERAWKDLQKPLGILDDALRDRQFLINEAFSAGDLNLASILAWLKLAGADLSGLANVERWLTTCFSRPALKKARER
jgi:glutathione S-transferase